MNWYFVRARMGNEFQIRGPISYHLGSDDKTIKVHYKVKHFDNNLWIGTGSFACMYACAYVRSWIVCVRVSCVWFSHHS